MKTSIFAIAIAVAASGVHADQWTGLDKTQHAIAGAAVGFATTWVSRDWVHGCAAATGVGVAKEAYDSQHRHRHTVSLKDAIVTAAAGCLAAKGTALIIAPKANGVRVSYTWTF